ncbi:MAG: rhodanese-like domain-containing protein [Spirochaetaceae bacterium]|nr:MAG: rhodanese-like domain-containing protein [Spirochaetaceae bacterium]
MTTRLLWGLIIVVVGLLGVATFARAAGTAENGRSPELERYTTPEGLAELIGGNGEPYLLVDVRTAAEFHAGHIPGAINIPYDQIAAGLADRPADRVLVLYCRTGRRSGIALNELRQLGYTQVVDFGGINRWNGNIVRP